MATILEQPISALVDIPSVPQQQRRPSVMEVIDVDLLDEPSNVSRPRPHSTQRREPEDVISLLDSDDEDISFSQPVASGSNSTRRGHRQRLLSPPPQPQEPANIPPVPRVPRRYSALVSLPMRRHPPPFPSPPVVPIAQPFDFEATPAPPAPGPIAGPSGLSSHPNRSRRVPNSPPRAAPLSHHVPPLGLGGALISLNNARVAARSDNRRERARQMHEFAQQQYGFINRAGNAMRRVIAAAMPHIGFGGFSDDGLTDEDINEDILMLGLGVGAEDLEDRFAHPARRYAHQEMLFRRAQAPRRNQDLEYKSEYTHPGKPDSGFVFDFAVPSPSEESKPKPAPIIIDLEATDTDSSIAASSTAHEPPSPTLNVNTLLVCAKCLDPLVLGGGLTGEEGRRHKVWALRCGHMIDGKCLDIIGVPGGEESARPKTKEDVGTVETKADVKGKGKAVDYPTANSLPENSMRSRLRSRASLHVPSSGSSTSAPSLGAVHISSPQPQVQLGKRKRLSTAKPRIEATYEWSCPVADCGKVHASVKIANAWVPEPPASANRNAKSRRKMRWDAGGSVPQSDSSKPVEERGAIAVFV